MSTAPHITEIEAVLHRHLPSTQYRAVLFGSRATGSARPGSDWDIGILGPQPLRGAVLQAIRDEFDALRTLHSFDVVDLATVPPSFRTVALRQAVSLV